MNRRIFDMLLQIFYFIPAILGTLFIAVGLYHGSKFYSLTRRCTQEGMGTLLGFEEKKMKVGPLLSCRPLYVPRRKDSSGTLRLWQC